MERYTRKDWLDLGLKTLAESGPRGLTINALAQRLEVTKGSFYHHFRNMRAFETELVTFWADQYLATSAEFTAAPTGGLPRLDAIMAEAYGPVSAPEPAIRTWAQQEEMVRVQVERIDQVRHDFLQQLFETITGETAQASLMADMLFTILIGSLAALPPLSPPRVQALYAEFKHLYGL